MQLSKYLFLAILSFLFTNAFAGEGYYVTFRNATYYSILIQPAGNDHWNLADFGHNTIIPPRGSMELYTENENSPMAYDGIVGVSYCPSAPDGVTILSTNCPLFVIWTGNYKPIDVDKMQNVKSDSYTEVLNNASPKSYTSYAWTNEDKNVIRKFYHDDIGYHIDFVVHELRKNN